MTEPMVTVKLSSGDRQMLVAILRFFAGELSVADVQTLAKIQGRAIADNPDIAPMMASFLAKQV